MIAATLTSLGLVLDIIGVVFVWWFGLPESIHRGGVQHLSLEQTDEGQAAKAAKYDRRSRLGLALLIAGFVLQLSASLYALLLSR